MSSRTECRDPRMGDLLAAYEQGWLNDEERAAFEAHLAGCEECLEEMYAMAPYVTEMLGDPRRYRRAADAAAPAPAGGRLRLWLRAAFSPQAAVPVAIAALLAIVVLAGGGGDADKIRRFAVLEHVPYVQIDTRAWDVERAAALFDLGMESYAGRDYAAAATRLSEAIEAAASDQAWRDRDLALFYLGVSALLSGDAARAVPPLAEAAESPLPPVAERARWELVQAYLVEGDAAAALAQLDRLAASPVFGERARAQRAELESALEKR